MIVPAASAWSINCSLVAAAGIAVDSGEVVVIGVTDDSIDAVDAGVGVDSTEGVNVKVGLLLVGGCIIPPAELSGTLSILPTDNAPRFAACRMTTSAL